MQGTGRYQNNVNNAYLYNSRTQAEQQKRSQASKTATNIDPPNQYMKATKGVNSASSQNKAPSHAINRLYTELKKKSARPCAAFVGE